MPGRSLSDSILDDFLHALTGSCSVTRGSSVLVCVSGGIDSMVLLDLMHRAAFVEDLRLGVIHVDHGLRDEECEA
jgi:tRNA(Ile)-lysidine synthase TilS/MesJ